MPFALVVLTLMLAGCGKPDQPVTRTVAKSAEPRPAFATKPTTQPMPANPALVAQAGAIGKPTFPAGPTGWTEQDPGAMRKGSWKITAGGGSAELAVTAFPGDVGGRMANINRWRGQLGLPTVTGEAYDAIAIANVGTVQGEVVDMRSADGTKATTTVMVQKDGVSWFFKLTGDSAAVTAARESLLKFTAETRLP